MQMVHLLVITGNRLTTPARLLHHLVQTGEVTGDTLRQLVALRECLIKPAILGSPVYSDT